MKLHSFRHLKQQQSGATYLFSFIELVMNEFNAEMSQNPSIFQQLCWFCFVYSYYFIAL